jgi:hypothetical protein
VEFTCYSPNSESFHPISGADQWNLSPPALPLDRSDIGGLVGAASLEKLIGRSPTTIEQAVRVSAS